ncbi:hybrid sensor histidine kinase/response regulator [Coraliomargarita akajimensis]|uniref:histidine kinase n=1 Tax=Coraliomargarita akajimensis (strain DSM 45221 / IAM 15411 / JCM 23193 / KCTC 12865 / 04OKA010-24) TaxID=583355 RepID=D5EKN3_CORAD|nr:response regulator [Coraliomargarita akajimensis]ADE54940.1 PAS/PAC sensor hybrid histidine kinase [Coraliomargarita akajimensis DSM 45221]
MSNSSDLPLDSETLLALSPDAVVAHTKEGVVRFWNAAAEALYGWSADEMSNRLVNQIFYLDQAQAQEIDEALSAEGRWEGELRQMDSNGSEHIVRSRLQVFSEDKSLILCYNTDITELRKQEDAESRAHYVRSTSLLASGVAHELNNALAPIMLSSAMLKRKIEDAKSREMLGMIEKCASKGADLVSHLLAYERGRGGGSDVIRATQIERSLKRATASFVTDLIGLDLMVAADLWEFRGELTELSEAFKAVIQNACEAMPEGGTLSVEAENWLIDRNFEGLAPEAKAGAYVVFRFKDTGRGIEAKVLDRVAEPFFTTKEPNRGYGFGLTNVQATVKGHHGFMVLESEQDHGTTLSIVLPAEMPAEELDAGMSDTVMMAEGAGRRILVADDEFFIRETIKKTLEEHGYSVVTAQDGAEALAVFASGADAVELVITNIDMPYMDGPALCRALKKLSPEVRILVSSGYKQLDKLQEMKAVGVDEFLSKPYTAEKLSKKVAQILKA